MVPLHPKCSLAQVLPKKCIFSSVFFKYLIVLNAPTLRNCLQIGKLSIHCTGATCSLCIFHLVLYQSTNALENDISFYCVLVDSYNDNKAL